MNFRGFIYRGCALRIQQDCVFISRYRELCIVTFRLMGSSRVTFKYF